MNREKAKALLPVITAFAEGTAIQVRTAAGEWVDTVRAVSFFADASDYRIKPEEVKVERFAVVNKNTGMVLSTLPSRLHADDYAKIAGECVVVPLAGSYER